MTHHLVVIGVSAGGLDAVCSLLGDLPADFRLAIVVIQHRSKDSDALCEVLESCTSMPIHEVTDKTPAEAGNVYLAPPDYHLLVEEGFFSLSTDAPEMYSRPSIDVAFETAADAYPGGVIGIVLTGANRDGSRGLRRIVDTGGVALVQDPDTAEVAVMPAAARRTVPEAEVLSLEGIARRIVALQGQAPATREAS
jgi:two-component system, chemotaxis family, protein-glutamate methylesterase/glutaminase